MYLKQVPQRSERKVYYELNEDILTITENNESVNVDLNELEEEHEYPIISVNEDEVTVIRFYGEDKKHLFENNNE